MIFGLPIALILSSQGLGQSAGETRGSNCMLVPELHRDIKPGWADEMNHPLLWKHLGVQNEAKLTTPTPGLVSLTLGNVPKGWPYEFQWSGVTREAEVNIAKAPVLMARVVALEGYAHLDVDVLDAVGKTVKGFRSTTLTEPGIAMVDLGTSLDPATYQLRIRLIVGGPNSGCLANYSWIRFVNKDDSEFLLKNPDFQVFQGSKH